LAGLPAVAWTPHLSLLYGHFPDGLLDTLAATWRQRRWPTLLLDTAELWEIHDEPVLWRRVAHWRLH